MLMDDTRETTFDVNSFDVVHPPPIVGAMKVTNDNNKQLQQKNNNS